MSSRFRSWQARAPIGKRALVDGFIFGVGMSAVFYLVSPHVRSLLIGVAGGVLFGLGM